MRILGIDYGRKKIGLAIAEGPLSEPWMVIKYEEKSKLIDEIKQIAEREQTEKIVVGISEGEMGQESKNFSLELSKVLTIPVETFDETLSSWEAQKLSREAGISHKKRKDKEDAYAASIILQNYLDLNG